jgi:serine/threonine protein kinase
MLGVVPVSAVECVPEELLAAFAAGTLSADELRSVERHLSACDDCRRVLSAAGERSALGTPPTGTLSPTTTTLDRAPSAPGVRFVEGSVVGRYVIESLIGAGSMGDVYAARDPELDRRVAIKVLRARASDRAAESVATRMRREAQAMARLSHPNVVTVHDVGTFDGRVFVAMEYVDGGTLRAWLREPRSWREVLAVFEHAGLGLAAAHAAGLVHRDFKPDNVLVGRDGRVRVTDFGLARAVREEAEGMPPEEPPVATPAALHETITRTGTLVGTPAYMAPEQLAGAPADARSDVFGFCVALYEALYRRRPFAGATVAELRASAASGAVAAPRGSGVPAYLHRALSVGLRRMPEQRYASMEALLAALRPPQRARSLVVAIAIGVPLALLGVVAATRVSSSTSQRTVSGAASPASSTSAFLPAPAPAPAPASPSPSRAELEAPPSVPPAPSSAPPEASAAQTRPRPTPTRASTTASAATPATPATPSSGVEMGNNGAPILR